MVTLHVSVWVEIPDYTEILPLNTVTLHVSVWVEILRVVVVFVVNHVTLHVSVWVEISSEPATGPDMVPGHAPRERVSWNDTKLTFGNVPFGHAPRERVSWNVVTVNTSIIRLRHAPRERVSWNLRGRPQGDFRRVTLHVSVWVEMIWILFITNLSRSRSTWACELKWLHSRNNQ